MQASLVRILADAVGKRILPIRPGDMVIFTASGNRTLIVCCETQGRSPEGNTGQRIGGITSATHRWWWDDYWLDWSGYSTAWTIHRS